MNDFSNRNIFYQKVMQIEFDQYGMEDLVRLGRLNQHKASSPLEVHTHPGTLEVCYLARGQQPYYIGNKEYQVSGGQIFWTLPDEPHSTGGRPEEKTVLYWLLVRLDHNAKNFLNNCCPESLVLPSKLISMKKRVFDGNENLQQLLDRVFEVHFSDCGFKQLQICALLTLFLSQLVELEAREVKSSPDPGIAATLAYIDNHVEQKFRMEDLAAMAYLSPSTYKLRFRKEIGMPPGEYILRKKIQLACERMLSQQAQITDIAYELNFSSSQYFSTSFKRIMGKSPFTWMEHNLRKLHTS